MDCLELKDMLCLLAFMLQLVHGYSVNDHYFCESPKAVCCNAAGNSCPADGKTLLASPRSGFDRCGAVCHAPVEASELKLKASQSLGSICLKNAYCCEWPETAHCPLKRAEGNELVATMKNGEDCNLMCSAYEDQRRRSVRSLCINSDHTCSRVVPHSVSTKDCVGTGHLTQVGRAECMLECVADDSDEFCCRLVSGDPQECSSSAHFQNACGLTTCQQVQVEGRRARQLTTSTTTTAKPTTNWTKKDKEVIKKEWGWLGNSSLQFDQVYCDQKTRDKYSKTAETSSTTTTSATTTATTRANTGNTATTNPTTAAPASAAVNKKINATIAIEDKYKYNGTAFTCETLYASLDKYKRNTMCDGTNREKKSRTDARINLAAIYRAMREGTADPPLAVMKNEYKKKKVCHVGFPDHYAVHQLEKPAGKLFEMKAVRSSTKIKWFYFGKKGCEEIIVEERELDKEAGGKNGTEQKSETTTEKPTKTTTGKTTKKTKEKTKKKKTEKNMKKREAGKGNGTNTTTKAAKIGGDELPRYRFVRKNNSLWNLFPLIDDGGMYFSVQIVDNKDLDKKCSKGLTEADGECDYHIKYRTYEDNEKDKEKTNVDHMELHYTFYNLTVQTCSNSDPCQHGKCVNKEEGTKNKPMITECDCLLEFGKEDCSEEKKEVIKIRLLYLASPFLGIIVIAVVVALITVICCDRGNRKERGYKPKWRKTIGVMAPDVLATLPAEAQAQQKRLEKEAAAKAAEEEQEEAEAPPEW